MSLKIKAVIFDMDGLIIDSEPLWRKAEINAFKEIGFHFTDEMCASTMGMRIDQVVAYWWNKLQWTTPSQSDLIENIINKMVHQINTVGEAMPGLEFAIDLLKKNNIPTAIASSSSFLLIDTVVNKLKLKQYFDVIHSAENEQKGKPDPAVFLSTAKLLNVNPKNCLVLEDSKAGMEAGINAEMRTIVIPENGTNPEWSSKAYLKIDSLKDFKIEFLS
ncbi:MAG: hexitol phosphatase HxpB [Flavobacteriales bacterium]|nr:hexitol phosphatase HxpB [Flavobacteriales bacterium]